MNPLTYTDPPTAHLYVNAVTSLSKLGEANFGKPLVLANYTGITPTLRSLDEVAGALDDVEAVVANLAAGHPRQYMNALLRGSRTLLSMVRGEDRPYQELVKGILEIDHTPIPDSEVQRLRQELHHGLGLLGFEGELEAQVRTWLQATSLTGDAVIEFGRGIIDDARVATAARVVTLPPGEGVDSFTGIRNVHYSGRSQYSGDYRGWLHFNIDKQWQRDLFVHVLCHEAYPGHQTFYALWDWLYQQGQWPVEAAYYQLNNPTNAVFEGGPESAMHFIGWDNGDSREALARRVAVAYMDLGRIAMNNATLWCNTGQMNREEAVELMVSHFVLRDDAERAYTFFTDKQARTNYAQYYYGRRIVKLAYERFEHDEANRMRFFDIIYRTPHTTSTFIDAVAEASGRPFNPFVFA